MKQDCPLSITTQKERAVKDAVFTLFRNVIAKCTVLCANVPIFLCIFIFVVIREMG